MTHEEKDALHIIDALTLTPEELESRKIRAQVVRWLRESAQTVLRQPVVQTALLKIVNHYLEKAAQDRDEQAAIEALREDAEQLVARIQIRRKGCS